MERSARYRSNGVDEMTRRDWLKAGIVICLGAPVLQATTVAPVAVLISGRQFSNWECTYQCADKNWVISQLRIARDKMIWQSARSTT